MTILKQFFVNFKMLIISCFKIKISKIGIILTLHFGNTIISEFTLILKILKMFYPKVKSAMI